MVATSYKAERQTTPVYVPLCMTHYATITMSTRRQSELEPITRGGARIIPFLILFATERRLVASNNTKTGFVRSTCSLRLLKSGRLRERGKSRIMLRPSIDGAPNQGMFHMIALAFDNRFIRELPGDPNTSNHSRQVSGAFWSPVTPTPVAAPRLLAHSPEMASLIDLDADAMNAPEMIDALAGNRLLPGMAAYATCYGGHQFGHWAGQLGDGRVIFLGEVINRAGQRWEMQLKGAGPTPYSRRADGRAVLRSSVREFLCSEAMHHLGIPTTRALSLVATGELVVRDMFYNGNAAPEPGAIVCRMAPSFIRFGHFEILAARGQHDLLTKLVDFTLARDFPQHTAPAPQRYADWFIDVCERTARLMAEWMRVGFVHGVMNTDNLSILGLTIDYGPYGWIDDFDPNWTPNTTDANGRRYCFGRQPQIARWNVERLGDALQSLLPPDARDAGLSAFDAAYADRIVAVMAAKFGLLSFTDADASLVDDAFALMQRAEVDMTDFFRRLATIDAILRPRPMSTISSVRVRLPLQRVNCCHSAAAASSPGSAEGNSRPSLRSACVKSRSPSARDSSCSMFFRWWRIFARARPVRTKLSHEGLGRAPGAVVISTTSPLFSSVRSATASPLTLAATQWSPTSEWIA